MREHPAPDVTADGLGQEVDRVATTVPTQTSVARCASGMIATARTSGVAASRSMAALAGASSGPGSHAWNRRSPFMRARLRPRATGTRNPELSGA
jgi:hypothetical protein